MARQFRGRQQQDSVIGQFTRELPGLMVRYMLDKMARGESAEMSKARDVFQFNLQQQRDENNLNLDIVKDYINDLNADKKTSEIQLDELKMEVEDAIATLSAHSSIKPQLDGSSTHSGSVTLPDHILNNNVLSAESKDMIQTKMEDIASLEADVKYYKKQRRDLVKLNASLDKMDKAIDKALIDPALHGTGLLAYVTDRSDFEAYWYENLEPIWADSPYKDIAMDVFFQKVPTSTAQRKEAAVYIQEIAALTDIREANFLDQATPALTQIKTTAGGIIQGLAETGDIIEALSSSDYDQLASWIITNTSSISTRDQANQLIFENLKTLQELTSPFMLVQMAVDENYANPVLNQTLRALMPANYQEIVKALNDPDGPYTQEYKNLKDLLDMTQDNQGGNVSEEKINEYRQKFKDRK